MTDLMLKDLKKWIQEGNGHYKQFYLTPLWAAKRRSVKKFYHGECVRCRAMGRIRKAYVVHHLKRVTMFPEFADTAFLEPTEEQLQTYKEVSAHNPFYQYGAVVETAMPDGGVLHFVPLDMKLEVFMCAESKKVAQLIPLCSSCHKTVHSYDFEHSVNAIYPERW